MKKIFMFIFLTIIVSVSITPILSNENLSIRNKINQSSKLTIYTYESLMADPYYDIESNFSQYAGIPKDQISIQRFGDANEIISRLVAEKDNPVADVAIGIDNALIHLINPNEVLEKYQPLGIDDIDQNLITNLDPQGYLIPYDYGIISLFYQNQIINASNTPIIENFTFDKLLNSNIMSKIIIENPKFSSPGLGFLLWTIAIYGDKQNQIDGLLQQDWREFWQKAGPSVNITKSWGEAFTVFFDPAEEKPIMVSYGTSPAYGNCLWGDESTSALLTHENDTNNGWLQIEGLGLVKNAPNSDNGKKFIDWFLSTDLQDKIPGTQWMYPANTKASIPECFEQASINPATVFRLNNILTPEILDLHLQEWMNEWEIVIVQKNISGFDAFSFFLSFMIFFTIIHLRKKNKQ